MSSLILHRLAWNETDFGGVSVLRIDPSKLWLPDIEVYNTAVNGSFFFGFLPNFVKEISGFRLSSQKYSGVNALVYSDGEVLYIPPASLKVGRGIIKLILIFINVGCLGLLSQFYPL